MNLPDILDTAVDIARDAGTLLREGFGQAVEIERKSSAVDWATQYDTAAEELITERLTAAFPQHGLIGEEGSRQTGAGDLVWYVDPLDGTTNFAHGFPVFSVSLALYRGSEPQIGVVYDPLRDDCFTAAAGYGAHLLHAGHKRPLHVSRTGELVNSLLATGFPYDRHTSDAYNMAETAAFLKKIQGLRRPGSAALDLAYVAAGRLDGYWEYKLFSWDIAAGVLLVQEAGGRVTDIQGNSFVLSPRPEIIASNGRIHPQMRAVLDAIIRP